MSVRIRTGRRRSVYGFVSNLLLGTFGVQSGVVAPTAAAGHRPLSGYQLVIPHSNPLRKGGGLRAATHHAAAIQPWASSAAQRSEAAPVFEPVHQPDQPDTLSVTASVAHTLLWPPNHEMWDVGLTATVTDGSGPTLALSAHAYSDEPPNGTGDGREPDALIDASSVVLWGRAGVVLSVGL